MSVDSREFRRTLAQFASGVTVVTTRDATGRPHGLTASSFCSVSLDPPLVLVCLDNRLEARRAVAEVGHFAVSVLAETQESLSRQFATGGPDKFAGVELSSGESGAPLVAGALAHIECRLKDAHVAGDHTIFVGIVERASVGAGRPLLYHGSAYHRLGDSPSPEALGGAPVRDRV